MLPSWTPLALVGSALILIPALFALPRLSEAADSLVEAVPFVVAGAALLAVPFSAPGRLRAAGIALAVALALAPLWFPFAFMGLQSLHEPPGSATFTIRIVPEDLEAPYVLAFPAPVDDGGRPSPVVAARPEWERRVDLVEDDGTWWVLVSATGTFERRFTYEWDGPTGAPNVYRFPEAPTVNLREGATRVVLAVEHQSSGGGCAGTFTLLASAEPSGVPLARTVGGLLCH